MMQLTSSNGLPIVLNYADIEIVEELIQLIIRQAESLDLQPIVDKFTALSAENILALDVKEVLPLLPLLQKIVCRLEGSKEFRVIIYKLLSSCTYNNVVITKQLFNDKPELREDYYMLEWEVVKFNITPFLKRLSGRLFQVESKTTNPSNQI